MMISALYSALAGMRAATDQLDVAASNIANLQTTGEAPGDAYHALDAVQTSKYGAPVVIVREKQPPTLDIYAPDSSLADADGFVEVPNVDLAEELVNLMRAETAYKANVLVLGTVFDMTETLFDMVDHHHHHHHRHGIHA